MKWFDPITERWIETKEKVPEKLSPVPQETIYEQAERLNRERRIWEAVEDVSKI